MISPSWWGGVAATGVATGAGRSHCTLEPRAGCRESRVPGCTLKAHPQGPTNCSKAALLNLSTAPPAGTKVQMLEVFRDILHPNHHRHRDKERAQLQEEVEVLPPEDICTGLGSSLVE